MRVEPTPFLGVFTLHSAMSALLDRAFAGAPLTSREYGVYSVIATSPEASTTLIAERVSVPLTTASDWVQTAIRRGHLKRRRSENDGRRYRLAFTAAGRAAFDAAAEHFGDAYLAFLRETDSSVDTMHAVLADMERAVRAAEAHLAASEHRTP